MNSFPALNILLEEATSAKPGKEKGADDAGQCG